EVGSSTSVLQLTRPRIRESSISTVPLIPPLPLPPRFGATGDKIEQQTSSYTGAEVRRLEYWPAPFDVWPGLDATTYRAFILAPLVSHALVVSIKDVLTVDVPLDSGGQGSLVSRCVSFWPPEQGRERMLHGGGCPRRWKLLADHSRYKRALE